MRNRKTGLNVLFLILLFVSTLGASANDAKGKQLTLTSAAGRYLLEIPSELMGRDILVVSRVAKGSAAPVGLIMNAIAGEKLSERLVRFEKGPVDKICLVEVQLDKRSRDSSSNGLYRSFANNNVQPVLASFDKKTAPGSGDGVAIDVTSLLTSDPDALYLSAESKQYLGLTGFQPDKSAVIDVRSFATHTLVRTLRTYGKQGGGSVSLEVGTTFLLLAEQPMRPRYHDERVGYYTTPEITDFDVNTEGTQKLQMITRWRLEPKPEDRDKYLRGELVEPQKPIVFYIDPATPKKWIPYFIAGVNDWQAAFERAGFKNAIYARLAPSKEEDSAWSLESAAYSNIVYMPVENEDASYSTIVDPRSGEIISSHIRWFHNALQMLRRWYFIQASPNDPEAHKQSYSDNLMGSLMRYVMAHEVGHALGFPHNFIASNSVPVEKLKDKKWVEANGHTPSIMDYARINYVAQPEDKIGRAGLLPRIGEYDRWALEWGYKWMPETTSAEKEKQILSQWIEAKAGDKKYWYGGQGLNNDPRSQSENVGDDAMKAGAYGIKNLKYVMAHLIEWTTGGGKDYSELKAMYNNLTGQYIYYMMHAAYYIGGVYESKKTSGQAGVVYEPVPGSKQKEALLFLDKHLFTTPKWLLDKEVFNRTGESGVDKLASIQSNILGRLLKADRLGNIAVSTEVVPTQGYHLSEYLDGLRKIIWKEVYQKEAVDLYRRNLQNLYVDLVDRILNPPNNIRIPRGAQGDVPAALRMSLIQVGEDIKKILPTVKDAATSSHYHYVLYRINAVLLK